VEGADLDPSRAVPLLFDRATGMSRRDVRRALVRSLTRSLVGATIIVVVYALLPVHSTSVGAVVVSVAAAAILVGVAIWWQVHAILRSRFPGLRAVEALAIAVTLLVTLFAAFYVSMSVREPDAFTERLGKIDALYFTMTTVATVGYGDITAMSDSARVAVMVQMVFNVVVIGVAVKLIATTARHRMRTEPRA
jgi:hypothetical protein